MASGCGLRVRHGVHVRYAQCHYTRTLTHSSWLIETRIARFFFFLQNFCSCSSTYQDVANAELTLKSHFFFFCEILRNFQAISANISCTILAKIGTSVGSISSYQHTKCDRI